MARSWLPTEAGAPRRSASRSGIRGVASAGTAPAFPTWHTLAADATHLQPYCTFERNAYEDSHCGSRSGTVASMNTTDANAIKTAQLVAMRAWNADRVARLKGIASHEADLSAAFEAARVAEIAAIADRAK